MHYSIHSGSCSKIYGSVFHTSVRDRETLSSFLSSDDYQSTCTLRLILHFQEQRSGHLTLEDDLFIISDHALVGKEGSVLHVQDQTIREKMFFPAAILTPRD